VSQIDAPDPQNDHVVHPDAAPEQVGPRRSARVPVFTERYKNYKGLASMLSEYKEPNSYKEALASEDAHLWQPAILDEYRSLVENETWTLVPLPPGRSPIQNRWVFKLKPSYGSIPARYKARLVARGDTQRHGFDYEETFAPVVKNAALRITLSLCAALDLEMTQLDIKTAFLYGKLEEEIYMVQPEGFVTAGRETEVCRLNRCIYGLKQGPRVWNVKFDQFLVTYGLTRSKTDPCVYCIVLCVIIPLGINITFNKPLLENGLVMRNPYLKCAL
jgi:hypothetical protein